MLYMVVETFKAGCTDAIYARLATHGRMLPEGLHYVESWVDKSTSKCFQLMRTDDVKLFDGWTAAWSDLVIFEVVELQSSAEAAAAGDRARIRG